MTDFILKVLGAKVEAAGDIAGVKLAFHGGVPAGWIAVAAVGLGALTWWTYKQSPVSLTPARKVTLATLRILFLLSLLLLLMRPVLAFTVEGSVRRSLLFLVDASSSMQIKDPRVKPDDLKRAAMARNVLDPAKGLAQPGDAARLTGLSQLSRLDLVKGVLKNERLDILPRLDHEFELVPFTFGQNVAALPRLRPELAGDELEKKSAKKKKAALKDFEWVDKLTAESANTPIGDSLREVVSRKRGQPLAGVVLVTDGGNNSGVSPREIAAQLQQEGIPLYIYGIGITSPRDIIVANLFAPEVSFVKDEMLVNVRVRSQGLEGEKAIVKLKVGEGQVAEKEITFGPDGEQVVPLRFTPDKIGDYELTASIEARDDETVKDNNARSQHLRVIDTKIKVLLVEQSPRWEYHYLHAMLTRDRRVEVKTVLFEGDSSLTRGDDAQFLTSFPANRDELFKFDLVIYGDVDPKGLSTEQMRNLNEYVSRFGGAFVMVAGKRFSPGAYRRTAIEQMLPVEFETAALGSETTDAVSDKPIRLALTQAGKTSTMMRLSDKDEENFNFWRQLPPIFWTAKVSRAKPGAEVLLVDPDPVKATRFGPMPVLAVQQYGLGQTMFVGTDNTWRWRKNIGDVYFTTFWGQIAQRMALPHMIGGSKRTQLTTDRKNFVTGERVNLFARLYRIGFEPVTDPVVRGFYGLRTNDSAAAAAEVQMRPVPDQPGVYRGEFIAPAAGSYKFHTELDPETRLDFNVTNPQFELGETAMNEPLLREMASLSGGSFYREESLHLLCDQIKNKTERVRSPLEVELWASPLYFVLMLLLVTSEWILRKMSHLK